MPIATDANRQTMTDKVIAAIGQHGEVPDRHREIATALVRHLHAFCREVDLQLPELLYACDFLVRAGRISDDKRQEFILLADILGVESLVDGLTHKCHGTETDSAVLGPFYRPGSPFCDAGASILRNSIHEAQSVLCEGRVMDAQGRPLGDAVIEIWQDAPNGLYENQDPDQPDHNLRGTYRTDADGRYVIRCIRPVPYPIPTDETAGELIRFLGHHPMRPAHLHFRIACTGYRTLVTQLYDAASAHLHDDAVFAVKDSLIAQFASADDADSDLRLSRDFILATD